MGDRGESKCPNARRATRYVCTVLGLAACALLMLWFGSVAAAQPREIEADPPKQQLTEAHRDIHDFGLAKRVIDFVLGPPECGVMIMSGKRPSRFGKFIYG